MGDEMRVRSAGPVKPTGRGSTQSNLRCVPSAARPEHYRPPRGVVGQAPICNSTSRRVLPWRSRKATKRASACGDGCRRLFPVRGARQRRLISRAPVLGPGRPKLPPVTPPGDKTHHCLGKPDDRPQSRLLGSLSVPPSPRQFPSQPQSWAARVPTRRPGPSIANDRC